MPVKEALKALWNPKAETKQKGKAVQDRPGVARVTEVIRALIPLIILGLVLLILHFAAPSAFNWVISYGSLGAKLTGSLVPAAIALLTIGIGVGNRVKHNHYLDSWNKKNPEHSNDNSSMFNSNDPNKVNSNDPNKEKLNKIDSKPKINNNKEELENQDELQSLIDFINEHAEKIPVTQSQLHGMGENLSERTLNVTVPYGENVIVTLKVEISCSNDTPFSRVKYLIAKDLRVITRDDNDVKMPDMPVMEIFVDNNIKKDNDEIGEINNIVVKFTLKKDDK